MLPMKLRPSLLQPSNIFSRGGHPLISFNAGLRFVVDEKWGHEKWGLAPFPGGFAFFCEIFLVVVFLVGA